MTMKKILLFITTWIITVQAQEALLVLPYCAQDITKTEKKKIYFQTQQILYQSKMFMRALSSKTEEIVYKRAELNVCDYFVNNGNMIAFNRMISSMRVDKILSCAINKDDQGYGLYYKLIDANSGMLIKTKGYGYSEDFKALLSHGLEEMTADFFDIVDEKEHYFVCSLSGGYLDQMDDYLAGGRLGIGGKAYGEVALEVNLYTDLLAPNIALTYTTPKKYWLFLKIGAGFISENVDGFSLTNYHDAPAKKGIITMEHSVGLLAGLGFSLPLSSALQLNLSAEADILYANWETINNQSDEGVIYNYYPEIELSYRIKF